MALAGALANTLCAVTGITNKSLRALMTGLPGTAYTTNQASYDLARLARNGLITRIPHRNLYTLTRTSAPVYEPHSGWSRQATDGRCVTGSTSCRCLNQGRNTG
jgi:hypothetical protein